MGEPLSECSTNSPPATPSRKWALRNSAEACSPVCSVWISQPTILRLNTSLDQVEVDKQPGHRAGQVGDVPTPQLVGAVGNPGGRAAAARGLGPCALCLAGSSGRPRAGRGRSWIPRPGTRLGSASRGTLWLGGRPANSAPLAHASRARAVTACRSPRASFRPRAPPTAPGLFFGASARRRLPPGLSPCASIHFPTPHCGAPASGFSPAFRIFQATGTTHPR